MSTFTFHSSITSNPPNNNQRYLSRAHLNKHFSFNRSLTQKIRRQNRVHQITNERPTPCYETCAHPFIIEEDLAEHKELKDVWKLASNRILTPVTPTGRKCAGEFENNSWQQAKQTKLYRMYVGVRIKLLFARWHLYGRTLLYVKFCCWNVFKRSFGHIAVILTRVRE